MTKIFHDLKEILYNPLSAFIVLIVLLCITFLAYNILNSVVKHSAKERFNFRSEEIVEAIADRMNVYEGLLSGGVALFNASTFVSREEWEIFVETFELSKHWPGVQAFGFSVPVNSKNKNEYIDKIRSEGFSDFKIKPEGKRNYYTAIVYIEPFDWRNQRAHGYDMWSNEVRREAMSRSMDNGVPATSGIVTLVQETDKNVQKGFLTYLPVYKKNMPLETIEERQKAFKGWVYSAFRVNDLMEGILGTKDSSVDFEIFDSKEFSAESLLFDSNTELHLKSLNHNPDFSLKKTVEFQGRQWTIYINSAVGFIPINDKRLPLYIAIALVLIDLLLFYIFYSMNSLQKRATALADEMTQEVRRKVLELERSNKDLEQFAYVASHDLQEPVRKMVSFSQLFEKKFSDVVDESGKKYIGFIVDGATRMQRLIKDLLEYSRVGKGEWKLEETPLNLTVDEAVNNLQYTVEQSNAEISYSDLPTVLVNKTSIVQLFQNLIGNSIKYRSEKDPIISINAERNGSLYTVNLKDNGIGIESKYLENIFVIFERLHDAIDYEGTGVGLAICKRIVDQHGGKIWAESDGKHGTTIKFTLPVV